MTPVLEHVWEKRPADNDVTAGIIRKPRQNYPPIWRDSRQPGNRAVVANPRVVVLQPMPPISFAKECFSQISVAVKLLTLGALNLSRKICVAM